MEGSVEACLDVGTGRERECMLGLPSWQPADLERLGADANPRGPVAPVTPLQHQSLTS